MQGQDIQESSHAGQDCARGSSRRGFAVGALAVGALAIGSLAIGRLVIGKATLKDLRVGRLEVRELVNGSGTSPFQARTQEPVR
jgi:hypothetical protein